MSKDDVPQKGKARKLDVEVKYGVPGDPDPSVKKALESRVNPDEVSFEGLKALRKQFGEVSDMIKPNKREKLISPEVKGSDAAAWAAVAEAKKMRIQTIGIAKWALGVSLISIVVAIVALLK